MRKPRLAAAGAPLLPAIYDSTPATFPPPRCSRCWGPSSPRYLSPLPSLSILPQVQPLLGLLAAAFSKHEEAGG